MRLGEVQVHVICDGCPLEEYATDSEPVGERTLTCYIPSEAGKEFKIVSRSSLSTETLAGKLTIDGSRVRSFTVKPLGTQDVGSVHVSPTVQRPFIFSEIRTSDAADALVPRAANMHQIGIIQVELYRTVPQGRTQWTPRETELNALGAAVPESVKIVGGHQASLGASQPSRDGTPHRTTMTLLDHHDTPYARFIFRYRARDVLRAQGIILTPGPPQTQASSSASSSSSPPSTAQSWQYHSRAHQPTPYQPSSSRRRDKRRARSTNADPSVSARVHSHAYPHPYVAGAPPTLTLRRASHPPSDANARLRHINALEAQCAAAVRNIQAINAQLQYARQSISALPGASHGHGSSMSSGASGRQNGYGEGPSSRLRELISGSGKGGDMGGSATLTPIRPQRPSSPIPPGDAHGDVIDLTEE